MVVEECRTLLSDAFQTARCSRGMFSIMIVPVFRKHAHSLELNTSTWQSGHRRESAHCA
jgi:hypothetical protein